MKRIVIFLSAILLIASCKQQMKNASSDSYTTDEYGAVMIDMSPSYTQRVIGQNGLPDITKSKMRLIVEAEGSAPETKEYDEKAEKKYIGRFRVGTVLKLSVVIIGRSGQWKGENTHTVKKGENAISIKLSKSATSLETLKFSLEREENREGELKFKLGFYDALPFFDEKVSISFYEANRSYKVPAFCRDRIGRSYVFYAEEDGISSGNYKIRRFTSEGEEDTSFKPKELELSSLSYLDITADNVTGNVFAVWKGVNDKAQIALVTDEGLQKAMEIPSQNTDEIVAIATRENVIAVARGKQEVTLELYSYNNGTLTLISGQAMAMGDLLKATIEDFDGEKKDVAGTVVDLLMRDGNVYVLYNLKGSAKHTAFGGILKYPYSVSGKIEAVTRLVGRAEYERKDRIVNVQDEAVELYGALKFVGFSEDVLYIADDGVVYSYDAGTVGLVQNKNRLVSLNVKEEKIKIEASDTQTWLPEKAVMNEMLSPVLFYSKENDSSVSKVSVAVHLDGADGVESQASLLLKDIVGDAQCVFDSLGNVYLLQETKLVRYVHGAKASYIQDANYVANAPSGTTWKNILYDSKQRELYVMDANAQLYRCVGNGVVKIEAKGLSLSAKMAIYDGKVFLYNMHTQKFSAYEVVKKAINESASEELHALFSGTLGLSNDENIFSMVAYDDALFITYSKQENLVKKTYVGTINLAEKTARSKLLYDGKLQEKSCSLIGYNKAKKEAKFCIDDMQQAIDGRILKNINKYASCKMQDGDISVSLKDVPQGITWNKEWEVWEGVSEMQMKFSIEKGRQGDITFKLAHQNESSFFKEKISRSYEVKGTQGYSNYKVPSFCNDKNGRTVIFYAQDVSASGTSGNKNYYIKRFAKTGEVDTTFTDLSFMNASFKYAGVVADRVTGNVFVAKSGDNLKKLEVSRLGENGGVLEKTVELSLPNETVVLAVQNNVFAIVTNAKSPHLALYEYKNSSLSLVKGAEREMASLLQTKVESFEGANQDSVMGSIVDLVMKDASIYALYSLNGSSEYTAFGGVLKYPFRAEDGEGMIDEGARLAGRSEYERNEKVVNVQDEEGEFYGALRFVGFSEAELYIADDGVVFSYDAGTFNLAQNKNRLVALKTATNTMEIKNASTATWLPEKTAINTNISPILFYSESDSGSAGVAVAGPSRVASISIHLEDGTALSSATATPFSVEAGFKYAFDNSGCFYLLSKKGNDSIVERYTNKNGQYEKDVNFVIAKPEAPAVLWLHVLYDSKTRELYFMDNQGEIYRYVKGNLNKLNKGNVAISARSKVAIYDNQLFVCKMDPSGAVEFLSYDIGKDGIDSSKSDNWDAFVKTKLNINNENQIYAMQAYDGVLYVSYFVDTHSERKAYIGAIDIKQKTAIQKLLYDGNLGERNCVITGYNKEKKEVKLSLDTPVWDYDGRLVDNSNKYVSCKQAGSDLSVKEHEVPNGITWSREWNVWSGCKEIMLFNSFSKPLDDHDGREVSYYSVTEENLNASLPSDASIKDNSGIWSTYNRFCYDQLGNFYCLRKYNGDYDVLRFKLGNDGKYNFAGVNSGSIPSSYTLVTVGASDFEKKFLMTAVYLGNDRFRIYYTDYNSSTPNKTIITAIEFGDATFTSATKKSWKLEIDQEDTTALTGGWKVRRDVTALHANKDGLFVAVREMETKKTLASDGSSKTVDRAYNIIVKKYDIEDGTYTYDVPRSSMDVVGSSTDRKNTKMYANYEGTIDPNNATLTTYTRERIQDMFAYNGTLYVLTYKHTGTNTEEIDDATPSSQLATSQGIIWKLGNNTKYFAGMATSLHARTEGENKWEFAPQHFIAVMSRKLVIASDGFKATKDEHNQGIGKNKDKVFFLKTDNDGLDEKETTARFSFKAKEVAHAASCGFEWD